MEPRYKYPKTMHLPWSPGLQNDDRLMPDVDCFLGKEVVITEKMDGENTTMYRDYIHARSIDSQNHPSRNWVKGRHGRIKHLIPEGWRICGENLYATHSIHYEDLTDYFMLFSVWSRGNVCMSWNITEQYAKILDVPTVPVLYRGKWDEWVKVHALTDAFVYQDGKEGYVVRVADSFCYTDFDKSVAKYVRKDHIQTDEHWMNKAIVPNALK